jgi:hypothetical protein
MYFGWIRIRIQGFESDDQIFKNTNELFLSLFWSKNAIYLSPVPEFIDPVFTKTSPKRLFSVIQNERFGLVFAKTGSIISGTGLHKGRPSSRRRFSPQKRTSSTSNRNMKFLNCFLFFRAIFALLDLDQDCKYESGYGSRDPLLNPDPIRIRIHNTGM